MEVSDFEFDKLEELDEGYELFDVEVVFELEDDDFDDELVVEFDDDEVCFCIDIWFEWCLSF